jgi:hypothetical protein
VGVTFSAGCLSDPLDGWHGSNDPKADHAISLHNDAEERRTVRVWVVREATGETVFETTRELAPGSEAELYNIKQANPDGIEAFRICGKLVGRAATATESGGTGTTTSTESTETASDSGATATDDAESTATDDSEPTTTEVNYRDCQTIRTDECHADTEVVVRDDRSVEVVYAVC